MPCRPYRLVHLLALVLICLLARTSAASWQVNLSLANGAGETKTLTLGMDEEATDGIDPQLGELELPPMPPLAVFDVRFRIAGTEGSRLDLRPDLPPERQHIIDWQTGLGGDPLTLTWDRTTLPYASMFIMDEFEGTFIPPVNMFETEQLVIGAEQSFLSSLVVEINLSGAPSATPEIMGLHGHELFCGQRFPSYRLDDHVFDPDDPDENLTWIIHDVDVLGIWIDAGRILHVSAPQGWLGTDAITLEVRDPSGRSDSVDLVFGVISGGLPQWEIPLTVVNADFEAIDVAIGAHPQASDGIDQAFAEVALPPWPPSTAFESRLILPDGSTASRRDLRQSSTDILSYDLQWQAGAGGYPITVTWDSPLAAGQYMIRDEFDGTFIPDLDMADTTSIVIESAQSFITGLECRCAVEADLVAPSGPDSLFVAELDAGASVRLDWAGFPCIEDHFAYFEVLVDTMESGAGALLVWDWSEDPTLMSQTTHESVVALPFMAAEYYFRIRAWDTFGNVGEASAVAHWPGGAVGVTERPSNAVLAVSTHPNPFNAATTIRVRLPETGPASIDIFDLGGRLIRRFGSSLYETGYHDMIWDGRDDHGRVLGSGVYFLRVLAGDSRVVQKITLAK